MEVELASFFYGSSSGLADNGRDVYPSRAINKSRQRLPGQRRAAPRPLRYRVHAFEEIQPSHILLNAAPRQRAGGVSSILPVSDFCPRAPWLELARHGDS